MIPCANILRQLLLDLTIGTESAAWAVYVGFMPETGDSTICLYDTAGREDGRMMKTGEKIEHPGIQVIVRGKNYPAAMQKVVDIAHAFDSTKRVSVIVDSEGPFLLHNISRTGTILPLGMEQEGDRRRHLFSLNAVVSIADDLGWEPFYSQEAVTSTRYTRRLVVDTLILKNQTTEAYHEVQLVTEEEAVQLKPNAEPEP